MKSNSAARIPARLAIPLVLTASASLGIVDPPVILTPPSRATRARPARAFAIIPAMARPSRPRSVLEGLALAVIVVVAFLAGMLVERLHSHAERDQMLRRYDKVLKEHRSLLMEAEKRQEGVTPKR